MEKAAVATPAGLTFAGKPEEQELASRIHELMRRQGMMFAADSPITTPLDRMVAGVSRYYPGMAPATLEKRITAALAANPDMFARQETDGRVTYVTTKSGRHPYAG